MTEPRVSVVMPVFNRAWCVGEAISSVLATREPSLELVVVDDGSTDSTAAVVAEYAALDPMRVRVIQHPGRANHGIARSRNLGVAQSRGTYVAFLDSDDLYLPHRFDLALHWLDRHQDFCGCVEPFALQRQGEAARAITHLTTVPDYELGWLRAMLFSTTYWTMGSITLRRTAFAQFGGFDDSLRVGEDVALWLKLAAANAVGAASSTEPTSVVRRHAQNSWHGINPATERAIYLHVLRDLSRWLQTHTHVSPVAMQLVERRTRMSLVEAVMDESLSKAQRTTLWLSCLFGWPKSALERQVVSNLARMLLGMRVWR